MSKYIATVIKTGNSYALRVPKGYIDDAQLELGEKAILTLPLRELKQDNKRIMSLVQELQELRGFQSIDDPAKWQKDLRQDRRLPGRDY